MENLEISVAADFTKFPTGRYKSYGEGSGEEFREKFLIPALRDGKIITLYLDGVRGYPASFLEEAFGGLIRAGFSRDELKSHLRFKATGKYEMYVHMIESYLDEATQTAS